MMLISADTQIGFLRDCVEEAGRELDRARGTNDLPGSAEASIVFDTFTAILRTVEAARALYDNRADGDPRWLSDLFHAVAPVASPGTEAGSSGTEPKTDPSPK